jgi:hypothetical protein
VTVTATELDGAAVSAAGVAAIVDPAEELIGILLTQRLMDSPSAPPVFQDFWTTAYQAIPG